MLIKRVKHSYGQTLVEFSLILPALILIVMGLFEFGRMLQVWLTIEYCAQAAARYASTGQQSVAGDPWDSARLAAVKAVALNKAVTLNIQSSAGPSDPGYFRVYVYASDPPVLGSEYPGGPNARVAVDVVFNHPLITPLVNLLAPFITLNAHAETINERFRHPGYGTPAGRIPPTIFPTPTPIKTATNGPTPTATMGFPTRTATSTTAPPTLTATTTLTPTRTSRPTHTLTPTRTPTPTRTARP
jgi:Flp pilus assembly protein TadG